MEILKFNPIFKPTLWGSETWVVSAVKGSESIVLNGENKGLTLPEVVERYGADFLGKKNTEKFGKDFPLLIKFIDARQDLSIQVHPDDELSKKRHNKMGKNEMWYVVDADRGSQLIAGFAKRTDVADYANKVADGSIENDLNKVNVVEGDCFYIPAGSPGSSSSSFCRNCSALGSPAVPGGVQIRAEGDFGCWRMCLPTSGISRP